MAGDIWARDWFSQEAGGYIRDIWGSPWGWGTQRDMDGGWRVGERGGSAWGRTWGHPLGDTLREHGGIMEGMVVVWDGTELEEPLLRGCPGAGQDCTWARL